VEEAKSDDESSVGRGGEDGSASACDSVAWDGASPNKPRSKRLSLVSEWGSMARVVEKENGLVGEDVPLSLAPGSAIDGMSAERFATERKAKSAWALLRQKVRTSIKEFVSPTGIKVVAVLAYEGVDVDSLTAALDCWSALPGVQAVPLVLPLVPFPRRRPPHVAPGSARSLLQQTGSGTADSPTTRASPREAAQGQPQPQQQQGGHESAPEATAAAGAAAVSAVPAQTNGWERTVRTSGGIELTGRTVAHFALVPASMQALTCVVLPPGRLSAAHRALAGKWIKELFPGVKAGRCKLVDQSAEDANLAVKVQLHSIEQALSLQAAREVLDSLCRAPVDSVVDQVVSLPERALERMLVPDS
jgi:hypothetical protein